MTRRPGARPAGSVLLAVLWRASTGQPLNGKPRSDATFFRAASEWTPHYWGRRKKPWWAALPGAYRAAVFWALASAVFGLMFHRRGTVLLLLVILVILAAAGVAVGWHKARVYGHYRSKVRPLHYAVKQVLALPPGTRPKELVSVPADYGSNPAAQIVIYPPHGFTGAQRDMEDLTRAVTAKLAIEAPKVDPILNSHKPRIVYTYSPPPPALVTWNDIEPHVTAAGPDELVVGIGKNGKLVKVSLSLDSPHLMINMGSGAGKSNLAAFWLLQVLRRGAIGLVLDAKMTSHPWVYKDMGAEFGQLPNCGYARHIPVMHDAMVWLGIELKRRYDLTERYINARGSMLGCSVGPELFIIAEEMNMTTPWLKEHWTEIRGEWAGATGKDAPKRSPALTSFGAVAFAGRAVNMHVIFIGQMLNAESLGVSGTQGSAVRQKPSYASTSK